MADRLNKAWYIYCIESYKTTEKGGSFLCIEVERVQRILLSKKYYVVLCKVYQQLDKKGVNLCVCLDR